jgi:transcriptional regulator
MTTSTLLPGTLDLLVLKAVSLGSEHGYGILLRIQRASRDVLAIEQGALYPALFRLETQGFISAEWGVSSNNRRAKFYTLTRTGKARLAKDTGEWQRLVAAMDAVLGATKAELLA